jgi:MFS family permease
MPASPEPTRQIAASKDSAVADLPADSPTQALPATVKLLAFASLLNDIASEMVFPNLPIFFKVVLKAGALELGVLEGIADTVASLLKLYSGGRSDHSPRRKQFVLVGYLLAALARPFTALATHPWHVVAARTGDRIGKGIRAAPRDAIIVDVTPASQRGRAFGFHRAMDHLGAVLGPLLAAAFLYIRPDDLRTLFLLTAIPGAAVVLLIALALRESPRPHVAKQCFTLSLAPFDANFRLYLLALAVFTLGNASDIFLLQLALDVGSPAWSLPILWAVFHVIKSAGNLLAGPAVDRSGPWRMIFFGWAIYAAIYCGFALVDSLTPMIALFLAYGVFYALTEPAEKTLVANLVSEENRGLAFGWFNFAIAVMTLPANLIFGSLYQQLGAEAAFLFGAAAAGLAALLLAVVRRRATSRERA